MVKKKNTFATGFRTAGDQARATGQPIQEAPKPRIFSRPEGTPDSQNVEVTNMPKQERERIQMENALQGQANKAAVARQDQMKRDTIANNLVQPAGAADLEQKQIAEQQQLRQEVTPSLLEPQKDRTTRLAEAGFSAVETVSSYLPMVKALESAGLKRASPEELAQGPIGKLIGVPLGFATTSDIGGVSLSTIFSGYNKEMNNLNAEANTFRATSREIMTGVSKGADVNDALAAMNTLEVATRQRYIDANKSLKKNPQAIANGIDLTEEMYRNLNIIQQRRHILERYQLTGDYNQLLISVGQMEATDQGVNDGSEM